MYSANIWSFPRAKKFLSYVGCGSPPYLFYVEGKHKLYRFYLQYQNFALLLCDYRPIYKL